MFAARKNKILALTEITSTIPSQDNLLSELSERLETEANFLPNYNSPRSPELQNHMKSPRHS